MIKFSYILLLSTFASTIHSMESDVVIAFTRDSLTSSDDSGTNSPSRDAISSSIESDSPEQTPRSPENQGLKGSAEYKKIIGIKKRINLNNGQEKEIHSSSPEADHKKFIILHRLLKAPANKRYAAAIFAEENDLHPNGMLEYLEKKGVYTPDNTLTIKESQKI